jgi:uncharacterized membrane protein YesL
MDMSRWYLRLGTWAFNLFLLNLLWFFCTCAGFVILGFFPATAALFAVLRRSIIEDNDIPVLKLFVRNFKAEFLKSNFLGYLYVLFGLLLYVYFQVVQLIPNNQFQSVLVNITVVMSVVYFITFLYVFPLFVHFDQKSFQYLRNALILAVGRPIRTIIMLLGLAVLSYICIHIPVLIPVIGISLSGYVIMWTALKSLPKEMKTTDFN